MQKLEQRIHICRISSFCHWLNPATPMAADHESQACRKQKIHPKSGISNICGVRRDSSRTQPPWCHWRRKAEDPPRVSSLQDLSTKWKELPCRMENLCLPCFSWEKSGSCAMQWILSIDELISLENKPFSPRWGQAQEMGWVWWHRSWFGLALSSSLSSSQFSLLLLTHK